MLTGAIVAGGGSTRFGSVDKALAPVDGTPMIRRVADRLAGQGPAVDPGANAASDGEPIGDRLVINCREDQRESIAESMAGYPLAVSYAIDERPDRGPVAGILNACTAATTEYVALVACDMPVVDPRVLTALADRIEDRDAAVPKLETGWLQPLQAVFRAEPTIEACERALTRGADRAVDPLETLECLIVDASTLASAPRSFENVNTPADRERVSGWYRRVESSEPD